VPTDERSEGHHLVVVGASAGGVEALTQLVAGLPADFPAALLVVLHLPPTGTSLLPDILSRTGSLPAKHAENGEPIVGGRIYVAPPGCHLTVHDNCVYLDGGPAVNGHRPAIDPLFESAAHAHGAHVAGVVLSGVLDDGTLGLGAIKRHGGLTIVQDPDDALYRTMPETALEHVQPDLVLPAATIGATLAQSATLPTPDAVRDNPGVRVETLIQVDRGASDDPQPGRASGLTCPACDGGIWEEEVNGRPVYRCRVGHSFSVDSFLTAQDGRVETALWTALQALEERIALMRRLAERLRRRGGVRAPARLEHRANETLEQAVVLRELLGALETDANALAPERQR
jgi:two-component system, chemotaxis family, protein-glutamate methylesterase/glutaminase